MQLSLLTLFAIISPALTTSPSLWGYRDSTTAVGPDSWHTVSLECSGGRQSPVDIIHDRANRLTAGVMKLWAPLQANGSHMVHKDNGVVVQDMQSRGAVLVTSALRDAMRLTQIRLHAKAEHRLNGKQYQAEAHFVFEPADSTHLSDNQQARSQKTIIAVIFDESGADSTGFGIVHSLINHSRALRRQDEVHAEWGSGYGRDLLGIDGEPDRRFLELDGEEYYEYDGSFTHPPCEETVRWLVNTQVKHIHPEEIASLEDVIDLVDGNARRAFPVNGRAVGIKRYGSTISKTQMSRFVELPIVDAAYRKKVELHDEGAEMETGDVDDDESNVGMGSNY